MTDRELRSKIKTPVFSRIDVVKSFSKEPENQINTQLYRMKRRGDLIGIKRGYYAYPDAKIDEFVLANKLYVPSYVSLESVLNISGVTPDITSSVTSVTTITSRGFKTPLGSFSYGKISKNLFFGYTRVLDPQSGLYYDIASAEKALLDFVYIRRIRDLLESRVDVSGLDRNVLASYSTYFPKWVRKVIENA
ncbi:MAG: hypothetical protein ACD_22C00118G0002 [uncultured bacterium]|nr:MAG: hypothetical protein ACD_22C00118G0002 [uncultured bacterium]